MYLTSDQIRKLSGVMTLLTQSLAGDELRQALTESVADLLDADYAASYVWDAEALRFVRGKCCRADPQHLRSYESEFQFTDPITSELHRRRYPTLVTQVMPQRDLVRTEFFDRFLKTDGLYWGINLYAHDGQMDLGDLRIWRGRSKQSFDSNEVELLRLLYPAVVGGLARASAETRPRRAATSVPAAGIWASLGKLHGLSVREAEVAELASAGLSDKEIARRAGIGFTTVRTHLVNAMRKIGCANRKHLIRYTAEAAARAR
jgi:DNA-binding CsgD family transcriptional regulator